MYNYGLILDKKENIYYNNVLEDTLRIEDSITRLYTLEKASGLDYEMKYYRLKYKEYLKKSL